MAGIYIHIPFCAKRCHYCDFFSTTTSAYVEDFVKALLIEIEQEKDFLKEEIQTIYFGGGTPSFIDSKFLEQIIHKLFDRFLISEKAEITIEANPDDLSNQKIEELFNMGFNRLSIGIQSFHDDELELMNRRHTAKEAINVVNLCKNAGFDNISIDLIYGLPGQDLEKFKYSVYQALRLDIQHISAYHLTYEPGTLFYEKLHKKQLIPVEEDLSLELFQYLRNELFQNGFEHYEISNFAKDKLYSKHNTSYWQNKPYLGLGPSAHSFDGEKRKWNVSNMTKYINGISAGTSISEEEILTTVQKINEYIMISLRTMWGINLSYFEKQFGEKHLSVLFKKAQTFFQKNLLTKKENSLILTEKGIFISDSIIAELFLD